MLWIILINDWLLKNCAFQMDHIQNDAGIEDN